MDDGDDDGQAAPPDPAAAPQAAAADAPAPDQVPAASAPPEPNQSLADAPAPAEPSVCIEPSQSDPATTSPGDAGSGSSAPSSPEGGTDAPTTNNEGTSADGSTQPNLTDEHYDWIHQMCGKNARGDSQAADGGSTPAEDSGSGGMTGVTPSGAGYSAPGTTSNTSEMPKTPEQQAASPKDDSAAVQNDSGAGGASSEDSNDPLVNPDVTKSSSVGSPGEPAKPLSEIDPGEGKSRFKRFLEDAGAVVAGAGVHAAAGVVPGGFAGAAATDVLVEAKGTSEQKFFYGLGSTAAGVADAIVGGGEAAIGIVGAPFTAGASLAITAEGVNEAAASAEAITAGIALMTGGRPGGGSSSPTEVPGQASGEAGETAAGAKAKSSGESETPTTAGTSPGDTPPPGGQSPSTPSIRDPAALLEPGGVPIGRPGASKGIRRLDGGLPAAEKMFDELATGGKDITPKGHPGKLVELPNGGRVGLRPVSSSADRSPSMDIKIPGIKVKKIHFEP